MQRNYISLNVSMSISNCTNLKHFLNVVVFSLEQLAPGGQVAVGEDATGFQQPVSMTL